MSADIIHSGHIRILEAGAAYGDVIVGVLTDEAIATYKRMPMLDYETRCCIFSNIKGVSRVVRQDTLSYAANLRALRPDYVLHGDDWKTGVQSMVRAEVITLLQEWGGRLIEVPYTKGLDSEELSHQLPRCAAGKTAPRPEAEALHPCHRRVERADRAYR